MNPSLLTANEAERLDSLRRYQVLDTPPEDDFDRITALLAHQLGVPVALISLVDGNRTWFKSHHGLAARQVEREPGLCASACLGDGVYVVNDARADPRTQGNPLVAGDFGLRFYAAAPLRSRDGQGLGTLCCMDFKPREFSAQDRELLSTLAHVVENQLEQRLAAQRIEDLEYDAQVLQDQLREQSTHDALTGLWNRGATLELLKQAHARARREGQPLCLMVMDIDHFKRINDRHGHPAGDQVLKTVAHRLAQSLRANDAIGRVGSEEFLCVLDGCNIDQALGVAERCRDLVRRAPIELVSDYVTTLSVTVSIGLAVITRPEDLTIDGAIQRADAALAQAREAGRDRVALAPD